LNILNRVLSYPHKSATFKNVDIYIACVISFYIVLCVILNLKSKCHNELWILINFLQWWIYYLSSLSASLCCTSRFLSLLRERELNCCRVIVHIARCYSLRNWVKQLTIGIQVTSQAHLRECKRRSINTKDNRFWPSLARQRSIINTFHVLSKEIINSINHKMSNIMGFNSKNIWQWYLKNAVPRSGKINSKIYFKYICIIILVV